MLLDNIPRFCSGTGQHIMPQDGNVSFGSQSHTRLGCDDQVYIHDPRVEYFAWKNCCTQPFRMLTAERQIHFDFLPTRLKMPVDEGQIRWTFNLFSPDYLHATVLVDYHGDFYSSILDLCFKQIKVCHNVPPLSVKLGVASYFKDMSLGKLCYRSSFLDFGHEKSLLAEAFETG